MDRPKRITLGGSLFAAVLFFGVFLFLSLHGLYLLWDGVTTQGVIIGEVSCSRSKNGTEYFNYIVEFTDQTGQVNSSTIGECSYPPFFYPPGDSVTMVYAPVDPAINAPLDVLMDYLHVYLFADWFFGLISLILFLFWRSKRKQDTYYG